MKVYVLTIAIRKLAEIQNRVRENNNYRHLVEMAYLNIYTRLVNTMRQSVAWVHLGDPTATKS